MKKVLFIVQNFKIGGTISSLYSLLSLVNESEVKVDVFAKMQIGEYFDSLPNCQILDENIWLSHSICRGGYLKKNIVNILLAFRKALGLFGFDLYKFYNYWGGKSIKTDQYDAVIGFDETLSGYISYLPAKKRISWIHCDYRRYANGKDESAFFNRIDTIVCVSYYAKSVFDSIYPQFSYKSVCIHNVINRDLILEKSTEDINDYRFDTSQFTIISCGRIDPVKQFSRIPQVVDKLIKLNADPFKWYILGSGNNKEENLIHNEIVKYHVEDYVIMLGMKDNVYPYMHKSDLYVCTSCSESFPMVVNEAKALSKPIVSNDFPSVHESVQDGINGYVCNLDEMPTVIYGCMKNPLIIAENNRIEENKIILNSFVNML